MFEILKTILSRIFEGKIAESYTIELKSDQFSLLDIKSNWPIFQSILSTILEEYKTLRAESLQISSLMITILQMGVAVAGVLFGSVIVAWGNEKPGVKIAAFYMLYLIIPLFVYFIGVLWSGEAFRFKRVGDFISVVEIKIEVLYRKIYEDNRIPDLWIGVQTQIEDKLSIDRSNLNLIKPLAWEQWLKSLSNSSFTSASGHLKILYAMRILVWLCIPIFSSVVGIFLALSSNEYDFFLIGGLMLAVIYFLVLVAFYLFLKNLSVDTSPIIISYIKKDKIK
jgi:hypothetical protein